MQSKEMIDKILKDQILFPGQGYAFYVKNKDHVYEDYKGLRNANEGELIDENTNFRMASITKQFTAFTVMTLIDRGLLNLDTTLDLIMSGLPAYLRKIKISQLLSHTSGIPDFEEMEMFSDKKRVCDNDVFNHLISKTTGHFEPGTQYRYSNSGYVLLGLIIEKVTGMPLDEYVNDIVKGLDMSYSKMNNWRDSDIHNRAYGHKIVDNNLTVYDEKWDTGTRGDGALYSSIADLKKWLRILRSQDSRILRMHQPAILNDAHKTVTNSGFGLEIVNYGGKHLIYHCGETAGTNSIIGYIPESDVEFIFITNLDSVNTDIVAANIARIFMKDWI